MLQIKKLYTEPEMIDPVMFEEGLNLILGEKDESSNKTNGVGLKTEIQLKRTNINGISMNIRVCVFDLDKEIIPAIKNSIQNILIITIKEEKLPNIGIKTKCIIKSSTNIPLRPLSLFHK